MESDMELRDFATGAICMIDCVEAFTAYRSLVQLPYFPFFLLEYVQRASIKKIFSEYLRRCRKSFVKYFRTNKFTLRSAIELALN